MTDAEIAALKAAAERATPGAWKLGRRSKFRQNISGRDWDNFAAVYVALNDGVGGAVPIDEGDANAAYIIAAHPAAILALLARLETAERNYNALKQAFDENPNAAWVRMHKAEARASVRRGGRRCLTSGTAAPRTRSGWGGTGFPIAQMGASPVSRFGLRRYKNGGSNTQDTPLRSSQRIATSAPA